VSASAAPGAPRWVRDDQAVLIRFVVQLGWAACDAVTGEVTGVPWAVPLADQSPDQPPQGAWVSRKGDKSYLYELEIIATPR
jgi:hypothetical protein